ncbi:MAG TPA: hypothetical protein VHQ86_03525 [Candidatus Saccharimonadia bacterium]|jgi:hypothetical protein|nr:hypothetical protein [Candidatus Saccharimonadia bacterium]
MIEAGTSGDGGEFHPAVPDLEPATAEGESAGISVLELRVGDEILMNGRRYRVDVAPNPAAKGVNGIEATLLDKDEHLPKTRTIGLAPGAKIKLVRRTASEAPAEEKPAEIAETVAEGKPAADIKEGDKFRLPHATNPYIAKGDAKSVEDDWVLVPVMLEGATGNPVSVRIQANVMVTLES